MPGKISYLAVYCTVVVKEEGETGVSIRDVEM